MNSRFNVLDKLVIIITLVIALLQYVTGALKSYTDGTWWWVATIVAAPYMVWLVVQLAEALFSKPEAYDDPGLD